MPEHAPGHPALLPAMVDRDTRSWKTITPGWAHWPPSTVRVLPASRTRRWFHAGSRRRAAHCHRERRYCGLTAGSVCDARDLPSAAFTHAPAGAPA